MDSSNIDSRKKELLLFNQLFEKYRTALIGFAMSYLKDKDDAEDVVQDVFSKIWDKIDNIQENKDGKSLLFTATKNACISHLRHKASSTRYQVSILAKIELIALENSTIEKIELDELQGQINSIMQTLPDDYQEIFFMNREEGLRYIDIAKHKNISVKTVEKKISLTLKILRNSITHCLWFL
ncbi:putative RNA polymerase sigma factor FecI [compost metagenome]